MNRPRAVYSLVIAVHPDKYTEQDTDWRVGDITVDWVDFTREKSLDKPDEDSLPPKIHIQEDMDTRRKPRSNKSIPGAAEARGPSPVKASSSRRKNHGSGGGRSAVIKDSYDPEALSLQPLVAHFPGPNPLDTSVASGLTNVGRGVVHLFRHAPSASLIASLDAHPVGESSNSNKGAGLGEGKNADWDGDRAEGEDGSLVAILAVPAWMRPSDFLEFIGGWATCLEGVRMIREATTPNRSIVLLKFRDPLQASDFLVIFTGRPFSTLDTRETCHPIRIHHLVLHHIDIPSPSHSPTIARRSPTPIPAFPPSVYASRNKTYRELLNGVDSDTIYELPSCPVCLERLDSTITGLVTLPCAHTFDCDCLRKWGDSRCPVCRVSHLLLASTGFQPPESRSEREVTRLTSCATCGTTSNNWICVVCGVVGCGRYDPGKGHARRHWEESGHVLAMELETQRVWDYKGDNYVHRLIQTRNDGKLVELPSASSLVTSTISRPLPLSSTHSTPQRSVNQTHSHHSSLNSDVHPTSDHGSIDTNGHNQAGPSSGDVEKMSSIESITLEYSYLLSSQLEAMRQHYETLNESHLSRLKDIELIEARALAAEEAKDAALKAKDKAEKRAEKATEVTRSLQHNLAAEKAMSEGLNTRITKLREQLEKLEKDRAEKTDEVKGLEETVRDLMFSLEAGMKIQEAGGVDAGEGGQLVVVPGKEEQRKKGKKKI